jgi:alkylation response protein AidB-like acyl-CoA dehydrogenase
MKSYDELSAIVKSIEPVLRENAAEADWKCHLPDAVVDAVRNAGLFKLWVPESLGGWQVDPVTCFRVFEDISAIDSAAGWLVQMSASTGALGMFLGDRAVEEMYKGGNNIFVAVFSPPGQSVPADGGYTLTGQFPFASNCKHADWFMALGVVMAGSDPRTVDGMPVVKIHAFPMKEAQIVENWDTLGMRGTGSHDVKATNLFVPEHRTANMAPVTKAANRFWASSFANMTAWHLVASQGMNSLGIARAAMDVFIDLAKAKTAAYQTATVNTQTLAHYRLGQAKAILGGARAYMYETITREWESAKAGHSITMDQKAGLQLAGTYAVRAACDAIELLAESAGGNAIRQSERFNRHLRDLRTLTQHAYLSADRYEDVGAIALGQPPRWGFLQF